MSLELDSSLLVGKIVGGSNATNNELKYMASMQINERNTDRSDVFVWKHYCGAGVIGPRFLLTAAQCIHYIITYGGDNFIDASALVGTNDLSTGGRRINIRSVKHNNLFCNHNPESSSKNDYGVILVSISISFNFIRTLIAINSFFNFNFFIFNDEINIVSKKNFLSRKMKNKLI